MGETLQQLPCNCLLPSESSSLAKAVSRIPLIAKFQDPYIPSNVISRLKNLTADHSYFAQAASPPYDSPAYPRNYTSWTSHGLSVGGVQVDENVVGGPAINPGQFVPAVILWDTKTAGVAWMLVSGFSWFCFSQAQATYKHYSTSSTISAVATSKNLTVAYPPSKAFPANSTQSVLSSNIMTFLFSGINRVSLGTDFLVNGTADLPGLRLSVSGNVVTAGARTLIYGQSTINDQSYYNLTYVIPSNFTDVPEIVWSFEKI